VENICIVKRNKAKSQTIVLKSFHQLQPLPHSLSLPHSLPHTT